MIVFCMILQLLVLKHGELVSKAGLTTDIAACIYCLHQSSLQQAVPEMKCQHAVPAAQHGENPKHVSMLGSSEHAELRPEVSEQSNSACCSCLAGCV